MRTLARNQTARDSSSRASNALKPLLLAIVFLVLSAVETRSQSAQRPPDRLVEIGGYHLHLLCTGSQAHDQPTIILSSGGGGFALDWALVQPAIADTARVCAYDRAGFGWSDPGPLPRTLQQEVWELRAALEAAGEEPPFVLVGHSLGGLVARLFASTYPEEVRGLVLVEATHESARLGYQGQFVQVRALASARPIPPPRSLAGSPPQPLEGEAARDCEARAASANVLGPYLRLAPEHQRELLWFLQHPKCYETGEDFLPEELAALYEARRLNPAPLADKPLVVIAGARISPPPDVSRDVWASEKLAERADLATLSTNGRLVTDSLSGHFVHFDNPGLVIQGILDVLRASFPDR